jgi:23S rRNA pseudouridine2605 synthase
LAHPRYQIEKEYEAVVNGVPDEKALEKLRKGVRLEDGMTAPAQIELIGKPGNSAQTAKLRLIIHEGRNRQVRRMFEEVGYPVNTLRRVRVGFIGVKGLQKGECRLLGKAEVERLRAMVGL